MIKVPMINALEQRNDLTEADLDAVARTLTFLLPDATKGINGVAVWTGRCEATMFIADQAFPHWIGHIHGRANDKNGHWRCVLRVSDARNNDAAISMRSAYAN